MTSTLLTQCINGLSKGIGTETGTRRVSLKIREYYPSVGNLGCFDLLHSKGQIDCIFLVGIGCRHTQKECQQDNSQNVSLHFDSYFSY